jgi:hypothetical protein
MTTATGRVYATWRMSILAGFKTGSTGFRERSPLTKVLVGIGTLPLFCFTFSGIGTMNSTLGNSISCQIHQNAHLFLTAKFLGANASIRAASRPDGRPA